MPASAVRRVEPEAAVARILELVTRISRRFGLDPVRDIQVLCPMNRGGVGAPPGDNKWAASVLAISPNDGKIKWG
jgi:hypothetical protein